jgi:hypothetical protein
MHVINTQPGLSSKQKMQGFETNNAANDLGELEYCIEMKKACRITAKDMCKPNIKI